MNSTPAAIPVRYASCLGDIETSNIMQKIYKLKTTLLKSSLTFVITLLITFLLLAECSCSDSISNAETSQIGNLNGVCVETNVMKQLCQKFSVDSIKDSILLLKAKKIKEHFIHPEYVLYFAEEPIELVGCDFYSIRNVYSPKISEQVLDGLDMSLSNDEQVRIRNRVLKEYMMFQCDKGKNQTEVEMKQPAIYSNSHKNYSPKLLTPSMQEPSNTVSDTTQR
jgi:hypothetical protein